MTRRLLSATQRRAFVGATLALVLMCGLASAQCTNSLTTTFAGGNGCSGNFFDVQATKNITVCSFDVHVGGTAQLIEVYAVTGGGPYGPVSGNPAAWTLLGSATVTGVLNTPTPLNLSLNYLIPSGTTQGFVIRDATSTSIDYTNGTTLGDPYASNADLTIFEGQYTCTVGATFPVLTSLVRVFNGTIHYSAPNVLSILQSGPGVGDLTATLTDISPTAGEGWTLITANTSHPYASGPVLGIVPDPTTWSVFGYPYFPGNPFHFNATDVGVFPNTPFVAGPGSLTALAGTTLDFVVLLLGPNGYDSQSNVQRVTFQ
jgi:hypothetical protein